MRGEKAVLIAICSIQIKTNQINEKRKDKKKLSWPNILLFKGTLSSHRICLKLVIHSADLLSLLFTKWRLPIYDAYLFY